jgi:hypothetical protein
MAKAGTVLADYVVNCLSKVPPERKCASCSMPEAIKK